MQVISRLPESNPDMENFNKGLQQLMHYKLGKMQQRQQVSKMTEALGGFGIKPEQAKAFATLPPALQQEFVRSGLLSSLQTPEQASQQPDLSQILAKPEQQPEQQSVQQIMQQQQQQPYFGQQETMKRVMGGETPQQQPEQPMAPKEVMQAIQQLPYAKKEKPVSMPLLSAKDRAEAAKLKLSQEKSARAEQHILDKQLKPYVESLDKKGGSGAEMSDMYLDRMNKLIDTGNLTGPTMYNFRKKMEHSGRYIGGGIGTALGALAAGVAGSPVPGVGTLAGVGAGATIGGGIGTALGEAVMPKFVGSKEDQEFTKLSLKFMDSLKDVFGGRIAIQEMQMYMDSIPTLAMTDEGKKQVIKDMKIVSAGWRHKKQIKDKIVRVNKGHLPANLEQLVEDAARPYLDKLTKEFIG